MAKQAVEIAELVIRVALGFKFLCWLRDRLLTFH